MAMTWVPGESISNVTKGSRLGVQQITMSVPRTASTTMSAATASCSAANLSRVSGLRLQTVTDSMPRASRSAS